MPLPFRTIPQNWRVPLFFAEVDNSQANTAQQLQRTLIIGQLLAAGTAVPNVPVLCLSPADAIAKAGAGSMIARMVAKYRDNDTSGELWILPLSDDGAAVAAVGSFNFTHVATANGVLSLYIAGQLISLPVASTQTAAQLATALAAAVTAKTSLPVSAAVDGAITTKVNFTAKNAGLFGNDIDLRVNYLGAAGGEVTPTALTYTIVAMATGATNPVLTTGLTNCANMPFDFIVHAYTDATSLNALQLFLNDATGRWAFNRGIYGHAFTALRGTAGALQTAGQARNDQHASIMGFYDVPNPNDEFAASYAAAAAVALRADPGRPMQTLLVSSLLAPPIQSQFDETTQNTLLFSGISTFSVGPDGSIALQNVITTYQLNSFGQPDNSYLQIETLFLLMFVLRALAVLVTSRYPRMKLADDGTRFAPGQAIVTKSTIRADIIAHYRELEFNGYVQNSAAFAAALIVEKDATNPNRVNVLWPGTLIDQLRMFALIAQFRLQ